MNRDESTYGKIGDKYDEWVEIQKSKPTPEPTLPAQRPYTPRTSHSGMEKKIFMAIGLGIAGMLLLLALWAFYVASKWSGLEREGAAVGYTLVGFFLLVAGTGGILATLNHNLRVLARPAAHH